MDLPTLHNFFIFSQSEAHTVVIRGALCVFGSIVKISADLLPNGAFYGTIWKTIFWKGGSFMNKKWKALALLLGCTFALSAFAACAPKDDPGGDDSGITDPDDNTDPVEDGVAASYRICFDNVGGEYLDDSVTSVDVGNVTVVAGYNAAGTKVGDPSTIASYADGVFTAKSAGTVIYRGAGGALGSVEVVPAYVTDPGYQYQGNSRDFDEVNGEAVLGYTHDPSLIEVKDGDGRSVYYIFSTGWNKETPAVMGSMAGQLTYGNAIHVSYDGMKTWMLLGRTFAESTRDEDFVDARSGEWLYKEGGTSEETGTPNGYSEAEASWWAPDIVAKPDGSGYWLDVVVHADDGRPQSLLPYRNEQVTDEGAPYDDEGDSADGSPFDGRPVDCQYFAVCERQNRHGRAGEHPFHDRDRRIPVDQSAKKDEIDGKTKLCRQAQQVAPDIAGVTVGELLATHDEQDGSGRAEDDAGDFFAGDRFFQVKGGDDQGQDRQAGRDDRRVNRRGHGHAEDERTLIEDDGGLGREKEKTQVFPADGFPLSEKGDCPEQDGRAQYPEVRHDHRADDTGCHDHFGDRRHDAPHGVGPEHGGVTGQFFGLHGVRGWSARRTGSGYPEQSSGKWFGRRSLRPFHTVRPA